MSDRSHTTWLPNWAFHCPLALLGPLALLLVAGCKPSESIQSYSVPRQYIEDERQAEQAALAAAPGPGVAGMAAAPAGGRMLAAIVDHGSQAWFFKLTGAPAAVGAKANAFASLIKSIHFAAAEDAPPKWTLPEGWSEQGGSGIRHNTLITSGPEPLEVSVTVLPKPPGDDEGYALSNINRWRGQLKLQPIGLADLASQTNRVPLAEGTAIVVDLRAADSAAAEKPADNAAAKAGEPPARETVAKGAASDRMLAAIVPEGPKAWFFKLTGPADAVAAREAEFQAFLKSVQFAKEVGAKPQWKLPDGWREEPGSGMRAATLLIGDGDKPLELSVIVLPKPPGDETEYLLSNINRWRGQMQLAPIDKDALATESTTVELPAGQATVVNLLGTVTEADMQRGPVSGGNR